MKILKAKDDVLRVGSVVAARHNPLHCGSGIYPYAIVISVDPFVMVSEATDMRWKCKSNRESTILERPEMQVAPR